MKYTKVKEDFAKEVQFNAGVICKTFDPKTGTVSDIIHVTSGGLEFSDEVEYTDLYDDVDNAPKNTKQGKRVESHEIKISGTTVSFDPDQIQKLMADATVSDVETAKDSGLTVKQIKPANEIKASDFEDVYWVGDYGDTDGGFIAIHLMNALNTAGFKITSDDRSKGTADFEYMAHYDIDDADTVPYEVYVGTYAAAASDDDTEEKAG